MFGEGKNIYLKKLTILSCILILVSGLIACQFLSTSTAKAEEASLQATEIKVTLNEPQGYTSGITQTLDRKVYYSGDSVVLALKGASTGTDFVVPTSIKSGSVELNIDGFAKVDEVQSSNSEYNRRMVTSSTMTDYETLRSYITSEHYYIINNVTLDTDITVTWQRVKPVFRLYNMITSEHLFTTNKAEYDNFVELGKTDSEYWIGEGIGWLAPYEGETVKRLYNPALGAMTRTSHYYSSDEEEIARLTSPEYGWQIDDSENWLTSGGDVAVWTCYNEDLGSAHHYTSSRTEWEGLASQGWDLEKSKNGESGAFQAVLATSWTFVENYYTVEHVLNNEVLDTEYVAGVAGEKTAAKAKTYPGLQKKTIGEDTIAVDNSTVVKVEYAKTDYILAFDSKGGSSVDSQFVYYEDVLTSPETPTYTKRQFDGWFYDVAYSAPVEFGTDKAPAGNITLYAKWTYVPEYSGTTGDQGIVALDNPIDGVVYEIGLEGYDSSTESAPVQNASVVFSETGELTVTLPSSADGKDVVVRIANGGQSIIVKKSDDSELAKGTIGESGEFRVHSGSETTTDELNGPCACTSTTTRTHKCNVCEEIVNVEEIAAPGHGTLENYGRDSTAQVCQTCDHVIFGNYHQNEDGADSTPIEWVKLGMILDGQQMLISLKALDQQNFDSTSNAFATSAINTWLNNDFYNAAFTAEEQAMIMQKDYKEVSTKGVKVALPPSSDASALSDAKRICWPTDYAKKAGVTVAATSKCCTWWTSSAGISSNLAITTSDAGVVDTTGTDVTSNTIGVRPAIYYDLAQTTAVTNSEGDATLRCLKDMKIYSITVRASEDSGEGLFLEGATLTFDDNGQLIVTIPEEANGQDIIVKYYSQGLKVEVRKSDGTTIGSGTTGSEGEVRIHGGLATTTTSTSNFSVCECLSTVTTTTKCSNCDYSGQSTVKNTHPKDQLVSYGQDGVAKKCNKCGHVIMGNYEQDGIATTNDEIEWIEAGSPDVDGKQLLVSLMALKSMQFNSSDDIYWSTSIIRSWLNTDSNGFFATAFSDAEEQKIVKTSLYTSRPGGVDGEVSVCTTDDSVFLLTKSDVEGIFSDVKARICYARASSEDQQVCAVNWWTRTPDSEDHERKVYGGKEYLNKVGSNGLLSDRAAATDSNYVRPALFFQTDPQIKYKFVMAAIGSTVIASDITGLEPTTYKVGVGVDKLPEATHEGKVFDCWCTDAKLTEPIYSIDSSQNKGFTLYARWKDATGKTNSEGKVTLTNPTDKVDYKFTVRGYTNATDNQLTEGANLAIDTQGTLNLTLPNDTEDAKDIEITGLKAGQTVIVNKSDGTIMSSGVGNEDGIFLAHNNRQEVEVVKGACACTSPRIAYEKCSVCDFTYSEEELDAAGHGDLVNYGGDDTAKMCQTCGHVLFGTYEQDADSSTTDEAIEWMVVGNPASDGRQLLVSVSGLATHRFDASSNNWEESEIRTWLNDDFYNKAFSTSSMKQKVVSTESNTYNYGDSDGEALCRTQDDVFLLSYEEVVNTNYFSDITSLICYPTPACANSTTNLNSSEAASWTLRSPSADTEYVRQINELGENNDEVIVSNEEQVIRPAIYFDVSSTFVDCEVVFDTRGKAFPVSTQYVRSYELLKDPSSFYSGGTIIAPEGLKFEGWYTSPECSPSTKWDFANDQVSKSMTLYANWIADADLNSYWLAPAMKTTTANTADGANQLNPDYVTANWNVKKSKAEIVADVKKIRDNDAATIAEYEGYMKNDNYHLYTKLSGTTTDTANDYVEFRIIQVGAHDAIGNSEDGKTLQTDESAITFQATHALPSAEIMKEQNECGNLGGWEDTALKVNLNGAILNSFNSGFTNDIVSVTKWSQNGYAFADHGTTNINQLNSSKQKLWLLSLSEIGDTSGVATELAKEGSQYDFWKNLAVSADKGNDAVDKIGNRRDGTGLKEWWLRSASSLGESPWGAYEDGKTGASYQNYFHTVTAKSLGSSYHCYYERAVVPAFCF
jgi:uncharacterized repeat protein (TIGR02543 family)